MKFLLDTNAVIDVLEGRQKAFLIKMQTHNVADIAISAVVAHELYWGAYNGSAKRLEDNLRRIDLLRFEVLPFDREAARQAGRIRKETKAQKLGDYDILIAGHALAAGRILVTDNTDEFSRVAGLTLQNWRK